MTPELYLRCLTAGVFSANFCFQGVAALLPWSFGDTALEQARTWLQWRYRLIPYVLGAIEDSVRTGLPVQRSMALSFPHDADAHDWDLQYRSEEHTSELQSLMRISYAVFCLKKK